MECRYLDNNSISSFDTYFPIIEKLYVHGASIDQCQLYQRSLLAPFHPTLSET